jgi:hypothetical protein
MQINNNPSVQNFGMALKIKKSPEVLKALEKQSAEVLEKIEKAGAELADDKYKFWDVVVDADAKGNIRYTVDGNYCANAYVGGVSAKEFPRDEFLTIKSTWAGTDDVGGHKVGEACETVMKMENVAAARNAHALINTSGYGIDNAVAAAKVLNEWTAYSNSVNAAKTAEQMAKTEKANSLLSSFGVDA